MDGCQRSSAGASTSGSLEAGVSDHREVAVGADRDRRADADGGDGPVVGLEGDGSLVAFDGEREGVVGEDPLLGLRDEGGDRNDGDAREGRREHRGAGGARVAVAPLGGRDDDAVGPEPRDRLPPARDAVLRDARGFGGQEADVEKRSLGNPLRLDPEDRPADRPRVAREGVPDRFRKPVGRDRGDAIDPDGEDRGVHARPGDRRQGGLVRTDDDVGRSLEIRGRADHQSPALSLDRLREGVELE